MSSNFTHATPRVRHHVGCLEGGSSSSTEPAAPNPVSGLSTFFRSCGRALASITHLSVTLTASASLDALGASAAAAAAGLAILVPLADACPQLRRLSLTGPIDTPLLQLFGRNCPKLTHLESSLADLSPKSLQQLSTLFPNLNSLTVLPAHVGGGVITGPLLFRSAAIREKARLLAKAVCLALPTCTHLRTLRHRHSSPYA